jgi:hypothetical protein
VNDIGVFFEQGWAGWKKKIGFQRSRIGRTLRNVYPFVCLEYATKKMTTARSAWCVVLEAIGVGSVILIGVIGTFGYICPSLGAQNSCYSTSTDTTSGKLQLHSQATQETAAVSVTASWDVGLQFYADAPSVLDHASVLPCASLRRMTREATTVRPPGKRIIVNSDCRPAPNMVDAGVCVQLPSSQRKEIACLPSLIIFGFQKCGTGELQGWLSAHPALHRWQGNTPQKSGAGEADYFNRIGLSSNALSHSWIEKYLRPGFILTKPSDAARLYTFEKSPK